MWESMNLFDDIKFDKSINSLFFGLETIDLFLMQSIGIFNMDKPFIGDNKVCTLFVKSRIDTTTTVMTTNYNMFYFENILLL